MRITVFAMSLALALTALWTNGAEVNAACPTPTCSAGGNPGDFFGTFGCTIVSTHSDGTVHVSLAQMVSDGQGNVTKFSTAVNANNASGTTFAPWAQQFTNGTYCLNSDDTGYVFPPAAFGCPFAIFIDISGFEVRLLDSTQNTAGAAVCEQQ